VLPNVDVFLSRGVHGGHAFEISVVMVARDPVDPPQPRVRHPPDDGGLDRVAATQPLLDGDTHRVWPLCGQKRSPFADS